MEPIIGFGVNQLKVIVFIKRLRTEVYQNPVHPNPFKYMGGLIGVEFSYHHCGSRPWGLAKLPPSLIRNSCAKEIIRVVKSLLLDEESVLGDEAEFLNRTRIDKLLMIVIMSRLFNCSVSLQA